MLKKSPKRGNYSYERNERIVYNDKLKRIGFFYLGINIEKVVYNVVNIDLLLHPRIYEEGMLLEKPERSMIYD